MSDILSDEQITALGDKLRGIAPMDNREWRLIATLCAQAKEANALREDAERYRMIRNGDPVAGLWDEITTKYGAELDAAIDAARKP